MRKDRLVAVKDAEKGTTEIRVMDKDRTVIEVVAVLQGDNQEYWASIFTSAPILLRFLDNLRQSHFFRSKAKVLNKYWETNELSVFDEDL